MPVISSAAKPYEEFEWFGACFIYIIQNNRQVIIKKRHRQKKVKNFEAKFSVDLGLKNDNFRIGSWPEGLKFR